MHASIAESSARLACGSVFEDDTCGRIQDDLLIAYYAWVFTHLITDGPY